MRRRFAVQTALLGSVLAVADVSLGFPQPVTDSPINNYTAEIDVNYNQVLSYSEPIGFDVNTFQTEPDLYWFKYVSNGQTEVTFDTLGSDFGTDGPGGNTSGGGAVLGSYNQSQIAVYTATGAPVAISKGTVDSSGNPIPIYPTFSSNPSQFYEPEGLSQVTFEPHAPTDPQWAVSPNDPTPFTGWAAPGNSGNSQKYYPPYYYTSLNEYHVWSTSLSTVVLDNNGNPVIDPDTGEPYQQPGWRYSDYGNVGPGAAWNQFNVLPAGTYYVAVASDGLVYSGDVYTEDYLEDPVWYDPTTEQNDVPQLSGPMGPWQYYESDSGGEYYGTIQLNVTQIPLPPQLSWDNAGSAGNGKTWDNTTSQNWNDGSEPTTFNAGADVTFSDSNNGNYSVSLNTTVTPNSVYFDNNNGNYTISGSGSIGGTGSLTVSGSAAVTLSTVNTYSGGTIVSSGTLVAGVANAIPYNSAVSIAPAGKVKLADNSGTTTLSSLDITDGGVLDLTNNKLIVTYGQYTPVSYLLVYLATGYNGGAWNGQGINSSSVASENASQSHLVYSVGYADGADGIVSGLSSGEIEILPTLAGDALLQGNVVFGDFQLLAANFGLSGTWDQGNFTYGSVVNFGDFQLLAQNFGANTSGLTAGEIASLGDFAAQFGDELVPNADGVGFQLVSVPEPATITLLAAAGVCMLSRRRKR